MGRSILPRHASPLGPTNSFGSALRSSRLPATGRLRRPYSDTEPTGSNSEVDASLHAEVVEETSPSCRSFEEIVDLGLQRDAHQRHAISTSVNSLVADSAQNVRDGGSQRVLALVQSRIRRAGGRPRPEWMSLLVTGRRDGDGQRNVAETRQPRSGASRAVDGDVVDGWNGAVVGRRRTARSPGRRTHPIRRHHRIGLSSPVDYYDNRGRSSCGIPFATIAQRVHSTVSV